MGKRRQMRRRRKFSAEFKAETVRLVRDGEKSLTAVARDLDLTVSAVARWVREAERAGHPYERSYPARPTLAVLSREPEGKGPRPHPPGWPACDAHHSLRGDPPRRRNLGQQDQRTDDSAVGEAGRNVKLGACFSR